MTTGDFRLMSESPEFDRAGESQLVGGRFRPGQTKDARELTMDYIRADPGMTTTTFAERGRTGTGTDFFSNLQNHRHGMSSRRSSNFDDSQPPSALLHTEEIYNDDYRPSRLASQGM